MKWTEQSVNKNISLVTAFSVFGALDFTRGVFLLFLLSLGLTNGQVGLLQSLLFFSLVICEIPTGLLADKLKRKYLIVTGCVLTSVSLSFYLFSSTFLPYVIAFPLLGAGSACISGANMAILYDGLEQAGQRWSLKFSKVLGNIRVLTSLATAGAMVVSGFIYEKDHTLVFILTITAMALGCFAVGLVDEPNRNHNPNLKLNGTSGNRDTVFKSLVVFINSPNGRQLVPFILGMAFIEAVHTPFFIFSQSLFKSLSFGAGAISVLLGCGFATSAVAMRFAHRLSQFNLKAVIAVIGLLVMVMLAIVGFTRNAYLAEALFFLINALPNLLFVLTDSYIQEKCDSSIRASLSSLQSFTMALFTGLSYLIIGHLADELSIGTAIAISSLLIIPGLVLIHRHFAGAEENDVSATA